MVDSQYIIAIDVGGSSVKSGLVDTELQISHHAHTPIDSQGIVLVMDNAPYHRSRAVEAMLSLYAHRVLVFWLPPYCPTLNPIERFWRHLKDVATANCLFRSVDELLANVRRVLHAQNEPVHPLRLTFSHD